MKACTRWLLVLLALGMSAPNVYAWQDDDGGFDGGGFDGGWDDDDGPDYVPEPNPNPIPIQPPDPIDPRANPGVPGAAIPPATPLPPPLPVAPPCQPNVAPKVQYLSPELVDDLRRRCAARMDRAIDQLVATLGVEAPPAAAFAVNTKGSGVPSRRPPKASGSETRARLAALSKGVQERDLARLLHRAGLMGREPKHIEQQIDFRRLTLHELQRLAADLDDPRADLSDNARNEITELAACLALPAILRTLPSSGGGPWSAAKNATVISAPGIPQNALYDLGDGNFLTGSGEAGRFRVSSAASIRISSAVGKGTWGIPLVGAEPPTAETRRPTLPGIVIQNALPEDREITFHCSGKQYTLKPGEKVGLNTSNAIVHVPNNPTPQFGAPRAGVYEFGVNQEQKPTLYYREYRARLENFDGAGEFHYVIGAKKESLLPGEVKEIVSRHPIVLRFDRGDGKSTVARELPSGGRYRLGINLTDGLWDVCSQQ